MSLLTEGSDMQRALRYYKLIKASHGPKKARFFLLRHVMLWPHSGRWLDYIDEFYARHEFDAVPLDVVRTKFLRSYYSRRLSPRTRFEVLKDHYQMLETWFRPDIQTRLLSQGAYGLGTLAGRSGRIYHFSLTQHPRYRAEGDLTLMMHAEGQFEPLSALTFSLGHFDRRFTVRVGGLQGPAAADSKERVVEATKDLSGWRPKAVVMYALYALTATMGASRLEAVATRNHPLRQKKRAFVADNDAFFEEFATRHDAFGDFILPLEAPERSFEEVQAKRRKDWLKRQELKAQLFDEIHGRLEAAMTVVPVPETAPQPLPKRFLPEPLEPWLRPAVAAMAIAYMRAHDAVAQYLDMIF